jgi:hypothetical protein
VAAQPLACWDCGFEFHWVHGYLCVVSVVCCQAELSASSWSLVQRSPNGCGVSECNRETWIMRTPWPTRAYCVVGKRKWNRLTFNLMMTVSRRRSQEGASRRLCTNDRRNFRPCLYEEKELYSEIKLRKLKVLNITGPVFRYSKPSRTVQVLTLSKPLVNLRSSNRVVCLGEHTYKLSLFFNYFSRPCNWGPATLDYDTPWRLSYHFQYTLNINTVNTTLLLCYSRTRL